MGKLKPQKGEGTDSKSYESSVGSGLEPEPSCSRGRILSLPMPQRSIREEGGLWLGGYGTDEEGAGDPEPHAGPERPGNLPFVEGFWLY